MKGFLKTMFASLFGCLIAMGVLFVLTIMGIVGVVACQQTPTTIEEHSVLHIPLRGILQERNSTTALQMLINQGEASTLSLDNLLQSIDEASTDSRIDGIYLEGGILEGATPAMLQELRDALVQFRKTGKFIYAYADNYTQGTYYVCSAASHLYLNPLGTLSWCGMASQPIFYKELLAKVGVKMQVFKVGTYKSAVEPYTNTEMSEANKQQVASFLHSIWGNVVNEVSQSRHISADSLNAYANEGILLTDPQNIKEKGLVDGLLYWNEMKQQLLTATQQKKKVKMVTLSDMANNRAPEEEDGQVAVYYAFGDIVDATEGSLTEQCICADKVIKDLDELRSNDKVKAVVLRINSGGGSAYASEQIWREVKRLKEKKPVIVSMGGMAASGGYYIASNANRIFAEPTTLTGSIGIFGMFPDASNLLTDKLSLHFDVVKTNHFADFGTPSRPFNAEEQQLMQQYINRGYHTFIQRVAQGRQLTEAQVEGMAQGRVWTGQQALSNKLVDQLGGLHEAVAYAAKDAKLKDYKVSRYPAEKKWWDIDFEDEKEHYFETQLKESLGMNYQIIHLLRQLQQQNRIQARCPWDPHFVSL